MTITARGGLERVVAAMASLVTNADVQRHGCGVLRNVASADPGAFATSATLRLGMAP